MVLFFRYILLFALGVGSAFILIDASQSSGRLLLSEMGMSIGQKQGAMIALLACVAIAGLASIVIYSVKVLPPMMNQWFERHKDRFATILLGLLVCLVFVMT